MEIEYDDAHHWVGQVRSMTWTLRDGLVNDRIGYFAAVLRRGVSPTVDVQVGAADYTVLVYADADVVWGAPCFMTLMEAKMVSRELEDFIYEIRGFVEAEARNNFIKTEILSDLKNALALYPRISGESLTTWYDRVIREHVGAPEYRLAHALGMAEGLGVDMLSAEFEARLGQVTAEPPYAETHDDSTTGKPSNGGGSLAPPQLAPSSSGAV